MHKSFTQLPPGLSPAAIRDMVRYQYPSYLLLPGFSDWLDNKWCRYNTPPDWKDISSLRENLDAASARLVVCQCSHVLIYGDYDWHTRIDSTDDYEITTHYIICPHCASVHDAPTH